MAHIRSQRRGNQNPTLRAVLFCYFPTVSSLRWIWCLSMGVIVFSNPGVTRVTVLLQAAPAHPVKVTSNQADKPKFCLGCHKSVEGQHTHTVLKSLGCISCHEVKTENEGTSITLLAEGKALCLMCHEDKNASAANGRVHSPVDEGECSTCHNPHSSPNKYQLVQSTAGGTTENLCLMCHDTGTEVPGKGSRHAALDLGCDTCHVTHKTGDQAKPEFAFHLTQAIPGLCLNCHDASEKSIVNAHQGQPISQSNCVRCHNPHASERPKLIYGFSHPPFTGRQCDSCHESPKGAQVALIENGKRALCTMCHEDVDKRATGTKHPHGVFVKSDTCTVCHSPHTSPNPQHLVQSPALICETCHKDWIKEKKNKKFVHYPVAKSGCLVCHEPHGTDFPKHLRAEINDLCLTCHAKDARGEAGSNEKALVLFAGAVQLPPDYLAQIERIPLRRGATVGHPQSGHPVGGVADRVNPQKKMSCVSCHDPHSSNSSVRRFVSETKSSSPLCVQCHK